MLKLKNVSKFYYNKGVIASGFNKVSIEFDLQEFVAIVGESGSGKSTLLNVISGLDSYEEGEMYINGEETSHYRESDFEEYRKKYVSNIFQNFNLVNSYTVYQNIELVMLLNGYKRKEIKNKVLDIIDKVGLTKYKNTKTAKLSGGQKQRVAIARALAKETPIIVCDEPTGNLDSKSAKSIIKLLKDISKDKLVIIVTHNIEQVEDVATRIVRMHDGKIVSDKKIKESLKEEKIEVAEYKNIGLYNIIRLGLRNALNIIPKFILLFVVFLFIATSLLVEYGSLKKSEYEESKNGVNYYFNDTSDTRIVIKKNDKSTISSEEFDSIKKLEHVSYVIESDILIDKMSWFQNDSGNFYLNGSLNDISLLSKELDYGRLPENDYEVVYITTKYDYIFADFLEDAINQEYYYEGDTNSFKIKVVGVIYDSSSANTIYGTTGFLSKYMAMVNMSYSDVKININGKNYSSFSLKSSSNVPSGCAYVVEDISYTCKDYNCKNKDLKVLVNNLYYSDEVNLKICNIYNQKNVNSLLGIDKENINYGSIYINDSDYNKLFDKDSYQASIYVDKADNVDSVSTKLDEMGYKTLQIRKTYNNSTSEMIKAFKILKLVVIAIMIVTLFFISYFVIKLILKSRNTYFSTLRILGGNSRNIKRITDVELLFDATLAYICYIVISLLVKYNIIYIKVISNVMEYLKMRDYILMYIILMVMSYLISTRFSSKLFKKSAMKSYREEV